MKEDLIESAKTLVKEQMKSNGMFNLSLFKISYY